MDGVWDAFVTGISGASGFGGAVDQIVVSPDTAGGKPTGLVAVDADLKSFVDSVMSWYQDTRHFDTPVTAGGLVFVGASTTVSSRLATIAGRCDDRFGLGNCTTLMVNLADHFGSVGACVVGNGRSRIHVLRLGRQHRLKGGRVLANRMGHFRNCAG